MASSTNNEDDDMEDEAPELNILTSKTIRMAVREISRSLPRSPKTRIKLLISTERFLKTIFELIQRKDPRIQFRLIEVIQDLQDMVVSVTNLIISLSAASAHKQISQIYDTIYNMGAYLENIIIEVYNECPNHGLTFADTMKDFLYSLMKLSCENGDSWLYSVLISPIVLHILNSFWCELDEDLRTEWCYDVEDLMIPLAKATFTCGDFYCQHYLLTIFNYWVRWAMPGKALAIINSVFQCVEKDARKELLRVDNTEPITRNFLNALNTSSKGPRTVIPISCLYMFVCNTEIRPPDHEVHREMDFWVDFSIVSGRLHAYYSIPGAAALASLSIRRDQIDSVCLNWVVNDSQDLEQDGDTQSTFAKDEKVLFFHIVLSVDFDVVSSDIESLTEKGYRSIYLVFRSGELVEKLMKDMGYSVHECGTMNCQRPRALRRLLATKHKLSYKESWCPDSQITGLDCTMNETRTSNVSASSKQSPLNISRSSVISNPCGAQTCRQPSTPFGTEANRRPSTPFGAEANRHPSTPFRRIRNDTFETRSTSSFISISVSSQEQDENPSPNSPNRPAILSLKRSRNISHSSVSVSASPNVSVNASQNVSANASPNVSVNATPNVSVYPFPNFSVNDSSNTSVQKFPNASAHDSPNASALGSPNALALGSPNVSAHDSPNVSAHDSPNLSAHDSPNASALGSPNLSAHDSPNVSAHDSPNVSAHDSPNLSAHDSPNLSAHDSPNALAHDSPNLSAHDSPNVSAHDSPNASALGSPNLSAHDSPNLSAHDSPNALALGSPNVSAHDSPNDLLADFPDESASISPTDFATNLSPNESVHRVPKGLTVSPSQHLNLKSLDRTLYISPNPIMNASIATSCEEPLPPEAREKYAHLYKHVPFHQRQETPKRIKSSKAKISKLMLVRNSSPKVTAPLQAPISPPVSEIGSPQHNIFNLTLGADLDATNVNSEDEDAWPTTPELSFGEGSDRNDNKDDQALSLSPVFGYSRTLEARGELMPPDSQHQSFETSISAVSEHEPLDKSTSAVSEHEPLDKSTSAVSEHEPLDKSTSAVSEHVPLDKSICTVSEHAPLDKSMSAVSEHAPLGKSMSAVSEHAPLDKSISTVPEHQTLETSVSAVSEHQVCDSSMSSVQPSSGQKSSTRFTRRKRRMTCYTNSFNDWTTKTLEKSKTDNYDPYDLWTSSEMDDYRDMLFPKAKTYGSRKRKESTRQGGIAKKRRTVKPTARSRNRFLMRFKTKDLGKESNSHSLELDFKGENPQRKASFFKRRD